jgi:hypothetical protein
VGVTLFDSAANLAASRGQAAQLRTQSAAQIGAAFDDFAEYEVLARAETPAKVASS